MVCEVYFTEAIKKSKGGENLWRTEADPECLCDACLSPVCLSMRLFSFYTCFLFFFHSFFHKYLLNTHFVPDTMLNIGYIAVKKTEVGLARMELIVYWGRKVLSKYLHKCISDYILCFVL